MKGYHGTLYEKFLLPTDKKMTLDTLQRILIQVRTALRQHIKKYFPGQEGALLLGMMIGERAGLTDEQYQDFVQSGIVHIIAVSGGNLVMIVVFLSALLFWLPFYLRNAVIILGVIAFAMIAGADSSVIRALIMSVLSLLALFRGREVPIRRLMQYAFVLMLCYNPYFLIYDLGFLLSFGALSGIVILSQRYQTLDLTLHKDHKNQTSLSFAWRAWGKMKVAMRSFWSSYGLPTL